MMRTATPTERVEEAFLKWIYNRVEDDMRLIIVSLKKGRCKYGECYVVVASGDECICGEPPPILEITFWQDNGAIRYSVSEV